MLFVISGNSVAKGDKTRLTTRGLIFVSIEKAWISSTKSFENIKSKNNEKIVCKRIIKMLFSKFLFENAKYKFGQFSSTTFSFDFDIVLIA